MHILSITQTLTLFVSMTERPCASAIFRFRVIAQKGRGLAFYGLAPCLKHAFSFSGRITSDFKQNL